VHPDGAPARTRYTVLRRFERTGAPGGATTRFSVVRAVPETGRLHQIRVHLAQAGFPVVGDKIYGPDEGCYLRFIETGWTPELARTLLLDRHALHAARLAFPCARSPAGSIRTVEAPMPGDMESFVRGGSPE
jgi:23S rRNA pseudouridine1911/1915/1917 synthase